MVATLAHIRRALTAPPPSALITRPNAVPTIARLSDAQLARIDGAIIADPHGYFGEADALSLEAQQIGDLVKTLTEGSAENPSGQYDFEFGVPYNGQLRMLTGAEYQLRELFWVERWELLKRCHQAWERNPWAKGALRTIRNFVVGKGHVMTYRSARVKQLLESFRLDPQNYVKDYDESFAEQLLLDGELFIRFTDQEGQIGSLATTSSLPGTQSLPSADVAQGNVQEVSAVGPVIPKAIYRYEGGELLFGEAPTPDPNDPDAPPITGRFIIDPIPPWWVEDMRLNPNFRRQPLSYFVRFRFGDRLTTIQAGNQLEELDASQILHVAINRLGYEIRGRPELWAVLPWLKAYKDWLEDRARANRYKGAILYDVTIKGLAPQAIAAKRAQYRTPPPPGSLIIHTENEEWATVDPKIGAGDVSEDGRQIKLAAAVGMGMPEYMLSDGQNANMATATAQAMPALRMFEDYQDNLANLVWRPIYRRRIELGIDAGEIEALVPEVDPDDNPVLDEETGLPRMIAAVDAFDVTYPPLKQTDPNNLAQALSVQKTNGWVSDQTAMQELGHDPTLEQRRMEAEYQRTMDQAAAGYGYDEPDQAEDGDEGSAPQDDGDGDDDQQQPDRSDRRPTGNSRAVGAGATRPDVERNGGGSIA